MYTVCFVTRVFMEERKKRVRATWRQIHSLESELISCKDELNNLRDKYELLEKSNDLMDAELGLLRKLNDVYKEINESLYNRQKAYESRSWFKRLFGV